MLRKVVGLFLVAGLILAFSQVGSVASDKAITLAIMSGPEADAHKRLAPMFEKATGIRLDVEEIPRVGYDPKLLPILAAHTGDFDVLILNPHRIDQWVEAGWVEPLNKYMEDPKLFNTEEYDVDDFPPALLDLFTKDGKLYALPQEASAYLLYWRMDLFKKYGIAPPPNEGYTWKEYLATARKLTKDTDGDGKIDLYGTLHAGKRSGNLAIEAECAIWSYGGRIINDDGEPVLNSPEAIEAVEMYLSQYKEGIVPPGMVAWEYPEVLTAMQNGMSAMCIGWNAMAPTLNDPEKSPISGGNLDWRPIPYYEPLGPNTKRVWPSVWAPSVCADSKNKEAAFKYITWFTSKEIARDYVMYGGGSSGRRSLLTDPEILQHGPQYFALVNSFAVYHSMPPIKEGGYLTEELLPTWVNAALLGKKPVSYYLNEANRELRQFLIDKGYLKG